ncbi:hypothetical protein EJ08DRAFT_496272 [Tothia fuscella]|uniref:DAPG hydrolase PhiG domain-containing protein n=1 Tax=Tothia fuscella TaxID=1048955 RepID=A0A9P4NXH4_9PEZI|nr:hypothetical protein EJ08DRAFT_496272 [Tothia fuscella]
MDIPDEDLEDMVVDLPPYIDATKYPGGLLLSDADLLLINHYLPLEAGYCLNSEGMYYVSTSVVMPRVTGTMIEWWFGYVTTTQQFKQWHPKDHEYSEWYGLHGNSTYIGGHHLVREWIGDELHHFRFSFKHPREYFDSTWRRNFQRNGYATAICARLGIWGGPGFEAAEMGHVIHLVKNEFQGVRMRSRFWLGDVPGIEVADIRARIVSPSLAAGLGRHCAEEMTFLAGFLPELYERENPRPERGKGSSWLETVVDDRPRPTGERRR